MESSTHNSSLPIHLYIFNSLQYDIRPQFEKDKDVYRNLIAELYDREIKLFRYSIFEYDPKNNLDNYSIFLRDLDLIASEATKEIRIFLFNGHGLAVNTSPMFYYSINSNLWGPNEYCPNVSFTEIYKRIHRTNKNGPTFSIFNSCTASLIRRIIFDLNDKNYNQLDTVLRKELAVDLFNICRMAGTSTEKFKQLIQSSSLLKTISIPEENLVQLFQLQLSVVAKPNVRYEEWKKVRDTPPSHDNFSFILTLGLSAGINLFDYSDITKTVIGMFAQFDSDEFLQLENVYELFRNTLIKVGGDDIQYSPDMITIPPEIGGNYSRSMRFPFIHPDNLKKEILSIL